MYTFHRILSAQVTVVIYRAFGRTRDPRLDLAVVLIEVCHCDYVQLVECAIMLINQPMANTSFDAFMSTSAGYN